MEFLNNNNLSFLFFFFFFVFSTLILQRDLTEALSNKKPLHSKLSSSNAEFPPRGWNSYDSFSWIISEEEFLENAKLISQRLGPYGYKYVVVDYLWYRKKVPGAYSDSLGFDVIDEWGRVIPDPGRWPSSKGGKGFTEIANEVHSMGLKFGIHVMRGISTQAANANTPILDTIKGDAYEESGRQWRAKDIGLKERACAWMQHGFMSVDTNLGAGKAFLRSLYQQYADWGVDFVKHDCVFGDDFDIHEISYVSEVLKEIDRPILYSLSPGTSVTPAMADDVSNLVNMYRITGDDWDNWRDVAAHFSVSRDLADAGLIGAKGLRGKSWPDLDMLPLGWLTDPGVNQGPHRKSNLTLDEQRTQMTLWCIAKSPIMFGGDMRNLDDTTYKLITDPILLELNAFSYNNKEFPYIFEDTVGSRNNVLISQSRKLKEVCRVDSHVLSLISCKDQQAKGWVTEVLDKKVEKICWRGNLASKNKQPFCLRKRKPTLTLEEDETYFQYYQEKHQLTSLHTNGESCLDVSANRKLTSQETKMTLFSPCTWHANQMWEFKLNGTLTNSYSGLCATVKAAKGTSNDRGIRSWTATGTKGKLYVAFFNLNSEKTVIYTKTSHLALVFPSKSLSSCKYTELWTGKDFGVLGEKLSIELKMHASALFVLNCNLV